MDEWQDSDFIHELPSGVYLDCECVVSNVRNAHSDIYLYLKSPLSRYAHIDWNLWCYSEKSRTVWNKITTHWRKPNKSKFWINYRIAECHKLIYFSADARDRKILLYKLYLHIKLNDVMSSNG